MTTNPARHACVVLLVPWLALSTLLLAVAERESFGAESTSPPVPTATTNQTDSLETLRSYLQLQEQLHATELAIERNRLEAQQASARNAEALAARLQGIEHALAAQRARELEAMQSSNRVMLIVAGTFAAIGLLAVLLMAYFQWRAVSRLAEISAALPVGQALAGAPPLRLLGAGDAPLVSVSPAEQSKTLLLGAIDRLEKRIHDLEHTAHPPPNEAPPARDDAKPAPSPSNGEAAAPPADAAAAAAARLTLLLGKGQSLLNLDQAQEALTCFEEALALSPNHAEALVKKGTALERLRKLDEAIACYDQAIAADNSMTMAYLCKGGLCNRLERFSEALECYERALRTQEKPRA